MGRRSASAFARRESKVTPIRTMFRQASRSGKTHSAHVVTSVYPANQCVEHHALSVPLHYVHYNFCRIHKTLPITPAMATGISDHVWSVAAIVAMIEAAEPAPVKRGSYKKAKAA